MKSYWVETVLAPPVTRDGAVLEPFTPFELMVPMRFGPEGSGATFEWAEHELELRPEAEGVRAKWVRLVGEDRLVKPGGVGQIGPLMFRVMSSPQDTAGWPARLTRPREAWTLETRTVLADQFLEMGFNVGRRFMGRTAAQDEFWFPVGGRWPLIRWFLGSADRATLDASPTLQFGSSLTRQAVSASLRQLELKFRQPPDHAAVVTGLIAGGGLPRLEQLRLKIEPTDEVRAVNASPEAIEKLRALPGFGSAFPALQSLEVEDEIRTPRPYVVVG